MTKRLTIEEFIERAIEVHGYKYDYSDMKYKKAREKVNIICPKHGPFSQRGTAHLGGAGCLPCWVDGAKKAYSKNLNQFVLDANNVHGDKYDYSNVVYKNNFTKVEIICKKHGSFYQTPKSHIVIGQGCPFCLKKREGDVKICLEKEFQEWGIVPNRKIWDSYNGYEKKRYCDFWLEKDEIKVMVEYDGLQHFKPVRFRGMSLKKAEKQLKQRQKIDKLDAEFCEDNNVVLHRIKYDDNIYNSVIELREKLSYL